MGKRIFASMLIGIILFTTIVYADEMDWEEEPSYKEITEELLQASNEATTEPKINSRAAIVIDRETKAILYEKNAQEKRAMASTTKIMTAIILIENGELTKAVEVSKKAAGTGGSRLGLKAGDEITLNDLLYGLMLCSGNDAAVAIAEEIGGSVEEFAILMNKKAKELNLKNTHFVTPHGLDNLEHYTTAYELALLTDYALNIDKLAKVVNTKNYTVTINGYSKTLNNTNELLGNLNGVNGVKTGFTNNAGRCLVTSTIRNQFNIITVVLGADTKKIRTKDSINLIEYTYTNYEKVNIKEKIEESFSSWCKENVSNVQINKGKSQEIQLKLGTFSCEKYPVLKERMKDIQIQIQIETYLEAPVMEEQKIGYVLLSLGSQEILKVDILVKQSIEKKDIFDYIQEMLGNYNELVNSCFV